MDSAISNAIAWLIPVSGNRWSANATRLRFNAARRFNLSPCFDSIPEDEDLWSSDKENDTVLPTPHVRSGLCLSFDRKPKGPRGFVIGTDPALCDIVLPKLKGISRRHCHITFDYEKRLILRDTSKHGTTVWYDGHCNGKRRRGSWLLSSGLSYGFPSMVASIIIEIQSVRFQVVVNTCLGQLDTYQSQVDNFLAYLAPSVAPNEQNWPMPAPLRIQKPSVVRYTIASDDDMPPQAYLWNSLKPWEPLVKIED